MRKVNKMVRDFAANDPTLVYIDTATPMFNDTGHLPKSLFKDDGLHLSRKGYDLWNKVLTPYITQYK